MFYYFPRKILLAFFCSVLTSCILSSCGNHEHDISNEKVLSSNDWYKNGVDRFYLAYMDSGETMDENFPYKFGEQFLLGIGCFGEPEDKEALVEVPVAPGSSEKISIPLNARTMLHQFNIRHSAKPKKGNCKILLGSKHEPQQITDGNDLATGLSPWKAAFKSGLGAFSCISVAIAGGKLIFTAVGGGYATAKTLGGFGPIVITAIGADVAALGTAAALCGIRGPDTFTSLADYRESQNIRVLAKAMQYASAYTNLELKKLYLRDTYESLNASQNPKKLSIAAAMWNKVFVRIFNRKIDETFENGWGKSTKFFDAVEEIQTEALSRATTFANDK